MRRQRRTAQDLRQAVDCLPARTREAMLAGLDENEIIVGAYTDRDGRVCPMLAAHRHGGRTSLASFARAWDRYTGATTRPRPATERELRTLRAMLETSLMHPDPADELAAAVASHRASQQRTEKSRRTRRATGERNRARELKRRPGWAWLRVFRRYDDFEAAVAEAERQHGDSNSDCERELTSVN